MKRILFISRTFPYDFDKSVFGVFLRMRMFLDALAGLEADLEILFYVDNSHPDCLSVERQLSERWGIQATVTLAPMGSTKEMRASKWNYYWSPILSIYNNENYASLSGSCQIKALETCLARQPDIIFVHRLHAMCPVMLTKKPLPPIFLDIDDVEHTKFLRSISRPPYWLGKLLSLLQFPALVAGERKGIAMSKKAFVCSRRDADYLKKIFGVRNIVPIPNAIQIPSGKPNIDSNKEAFITQKKVLFLGSFTYEPNMAAAQYLIEHIWPIVSKAVPDSCLIIAGDRPDRIPSYKRNLSNIKFTGFVQDLNDLYGQTLVVCCPILTGGGTRIKIIEAAIHGKCVVSTTIGAEGLEFINEQEILLRDTVETLASACIELLMNPRRCEMIGLKAKLKAEELYDRLNIISCIKQEISA